MNGYFFDMDGTLYNNKFHEVSKKTFEMLNELQVQGHYVALCTSRCQRELKNLPSCMRNFQFDCMISDGGALILGKDREIIEMNCIPKETMKRIDLFCKEHHLEYRYSTLNGNYFGTPYSKFAHNIYFHLYLNSPVFKPYEDDDVLNVLLLCEGEEKEQVKALIQQVVTNNVSNSEDASRQVDVTISDKTTQKPTSASDLTGQISTGKTYKVEANTAPGSKTGLIAEVKITENTTGTNKNTTNTNT